MMLSIKGPPATSGYPASAADVKQKGNGSGKLLFWAYSIVASIALQAVMRAMVPRHEAVEIAQTGRVIKQQTNAMDHTGEATFIEDVAYALYLTCISLPIIHFGGVEAFKRFL